MSYFKRMEILKYNYPFYSINFIAALEAWHDIIHSILIALQLIWYNVIITIIYIITQNSLRRSPELWSRRLAGPCYALAY